MVRACCVFIILIWKRASQHSRENFSTSQLPKMLNSALRQKGTQFFISHLTRWLRTRLFSEPIFRLVGTPKHWENIMFCDFYLVAHLHLLSSDSFFSLIFFSDLLSSSFLFSGSSRLCFSICPYCRKFDLCISFDYTFSI